MEDLVIHKTPALYMQQVGRAKRTAAGDYCLVMAQNIQAAKVTEQDVLDAEIPDVG